jgi:uncharacterized protein YuzE
VPRFAFDYDAENDDLFVYRKGSKSKGSVELDSLILDFDAKGRLTALQIIGASAWLSQQPGASRVTKAQLGRIKDCRVEIKVKGNMLFVFLLLILPEMKQLSQQLVIPNIVKTTPALM